MKKTKCNLKRIKEFAQFGNFDVHFQGDKIKIGLSNGESKYMATLGFKRAEQIKLLDCMEDNPKRLKKVLGLK